MTTLWWPWPWTIRANWTQHERVRDTRRIVVKKLRSSRALSQSPQVVTHPGQTDTQFARHIVIVTYAHHHMTCASEAWPEISVVENAHATNTRTLFGSNTFRQTNRDFTLHPQVAELWA
ncbi:predicted protein [Coccidioides posadasii str. Silveira]|uniref:Predicted protein n=1 Tax=Coccidioides posadasii (strain RMSCC 757 / Silveira) TaxID=443226 RepID=E9CX91_COCPS|nr:predicted protein [Coccidioides posadasii str. Silveira]